MRCFVGCPVPASPVYEEVTAALAAHHDAKPVAPGSWHVTLRFLGDIDDPAPVIAALDAVAARHAAMPCTVTGVGAFQSPRKARIVWARADADGLASLAADVVGATAAFGEPPDAREFVPHVTLARMRRPEDLRVFVDAGRDMHFAAGVLDRVVLYRSVLAPEGARYERVHEAFLAEP